MIHRVSQKKFSRDTNARKALFKNLANDLILHERIVTTTAKAKAIRPYVEKLVTRSKEDTMTNRRLLIAKLGRENTVEKLLDLIGPTFKERLGGYTRILKVGPRAGDRAPMSLIEFVEKVSEKAAKAKLQKKPKKEVAKKKVEKKEGKKEAKVSKDKKEKKDSKKKAKTTVKTKPATNKKSK